METTHLEEKINQLAKGLCEAVDLSIELRARSPERRTEVIHLWEKLLGQFFGYIRQRSHETKDNLLAGISWTRLKVF